MNAILTGSRVYGKPTLGSDIDLVVQMSDTDIRQLTMLLGSGIDAEYIKEYGIKSETTIRLGQMNLILCSPEGFEKWNQGTKMLKSVKPVSRSFAIRIFDALFGLNKS